MNSYAERFYSKEYFDNNNIQMIGQMVKTPFQNIKDEWKCDFDIDDDNDDNWVTIDYCELSELTEDDLNYEYVWYDDFVLKDFMNNIIKPYDNYLVCAYNSNWLGQTGYKFAHNVVDTIARSYDVHQYVSGSSKGGKCLRINEYSHDVPMGHSTIIIGLTDKEYDKLCNADYDTIINFADKQIKTVLDF